VRRDSADANQGLDDAAGNDLRGTPDAVGQPISSGAGLVSGPRGRSLSSNYSPDSDSIPVVHFGECGGSKFFGLVERFL